MAQNNQPDMNLLDLPDMNVNFDEPNSCSCGLKNADELLHYFLPYLEDWSNARYSMHEFARKYADKGIALWTANDVNDEKERIQTIQIFVENDEITGYLLFHYKLLSKEKLQ